MRNIYGTFDMDFFNENSKKLQRALKNIISNDLYHSLKIHHDFSLNFCVIWMKFQNIEVYWNCLRKNKFDIWMELFYEPLT